MQNFLRLSILSFVFAATSLWHHAAVAQDSTAGVPQTLNLPDGFSARVIYSVPEEQGSWVSITTDPKGRLIASSQYGGIFRITPGSDDAETIVEPLTTKIGRAQGLLCAFESLYVVSHRGEGMPPGLFRCKDTNGDDQYDEVKLLREFEGGSEHGPHAVILSPDKKSLYICAGNMTKIPKPEKSRVPRNWDEDQLIERLPDANGHAAGRMAPGGWICKTDPDGSSFELVCSGFRNEYDIAFAPNGELFTYDADMEWDVGLPWYRPTRVCHVVSGGEFGWRNGNGKWPKYYPDSLPPVYEVGPGSPTGITIGTGAKFPAKYQNALFISDWSYGIIYALTLEPSGASWTATSERFCSSNALPVTDVTINPKNGAMYFLIGGRRSQSALYEVTYKGDESVAPTGNFPQLTALHQTRLELEDLHQKVDDDSAMELITKNLAHSDRHIRYAARVALEHQQVDNWQPLLESKDAWSTLEASIAIARSASDSMEAYEAAVESLNGIDWQSLNKAQRLHLLRSYGLLMIRFQKSEDRIKSGIARLETYFPSGDLDLDRELSKLLIAADLKDSNVVAKSMQKLLDAGSQEEQVAYAWHLAAAKSGWSPELQVQYFNWFLDSSNFLGGNSFGGYIKNIRSMAVNQLSDAQKTQLGDLITREPEKKDPYADLKARDVVQDWTVDDLMPITDAELLSRDLENGKKMFAVGSCYKCHRIAGEGGRIGPELTAAGNRFNTKDLLTTLIEPSKSISDQYSATVFAMEDGDTIVGRVVNLAGAEYWVQPDMIDPNTMVKIKVKEIEAMKESSLSPMPEGLLDTMTRDDVLDLIAYMRSHGTAPNE